jgi:hypothetical protein
MTPALITDNTTNVTAPARLDLLLGAEVKMPPQFGTFKQAQRVKQAQGAQLAFDVEA